VIDCLGLVFIYYYLPETERRTLEDIELHFSDNSKKLRDIEIPRGKLQKATAKGIENKAYESDGANKY
jgi:hypothetical protein